MGNYTPEQVEAIAAKLADSVSIDNGKATGPVAAPMLYAYAATLRQQAGRVDEVTDAMVERDWLAYDEAVETCAASDLPAKLRVAMRAALEAALSAPDPDNLRKCLHPDCGRFDGPRKVECRARQHNACAALSAPEPAAQAVGEIIRPAKSRNAPVGASVRWFDREPPVGTKLYTAPPAQPAERAPPREPNMAMLRDGLAHSYCPPMTAEALSRIWTAMWDAAPAERVPEVPRRKASDYASGTYGPDDLAAIWNCCCEAHKRASPAPSQPAERVPEGWVLVPREPTEEMLAQAATHDTSPRDAATDQWNRDTWNFMLDAAPEPPASPAAPADGDNPDLSVAEVDGRIYVSPAGAAR